MTPPTSLAGNQADPAAMQAYAEAAAAWARYMQLLNAPRQQQLAVPMHMPSAHVPPPVPRSATAPSSKRLNAGESGSSMWTIIVCLVIGAVIGFCCGAQDPASQQQQEQPLQQRGSR
jgi:hypothetical protein